jgi:Mg-chelatase subunit ChlD
MGEAAVALPGNSNNLELNKGDNFIFGVDVSGSMSTADCPGNSSRIEYLKEKVIQFAKEASQWDEDGIDILTFGHQVVGYNNVTAEKAEELIKSFKANEMQTQTAKLIAKAYEMHKNGKYEQTVLFVATDGEPADRQAVKNEIVRITKDVKDEREFNISFLTVGNISPELRAFLNALDDDLKEAKYDIVDVKALEDVDFVSAFAGALND